MPPKNHKGTKKHQDTHANGASALHGLKPNTPLTPTTPLTAISPQPGHKSRYEEVQEDELIALASIYGDDFKNIENNTGAWKKSEPSFEIRINSSDDETAVTLAATLTATYPKTAPLLQIKDNGGLKESTRFKVQKVIETRPAELIAGEEPMIMDIVTACQDILEDAAQAKAAGLELPSLEEERAAHEATINRLAEEQRQEEEKRLQLETQEQERNLGSLLEMEMQRQKAKVKETKRKSQPLPSLTTQNSRLNATAAEDDSLAFEQPITVIDASGNPSPVFQVVAGKVLIRRGPVSKCFTVRPVVPQNSEQIPNLILKQTDLSSNVKDSSSYKKQLQSLETELETLKKIRHQNILGVLDFKVHKSIETSDADASWTVSILCEYGNKGSLEELLEIAGSLGVNKVRSWTIELLDALRFLHDQGIAHEDIHPSNVLLIRNSFGEVRPKLADAGFQQKLHFLTRRKHPSDTISLAKSAYWLPPETASTKTPQYTQKTDLWDFGILFLQMIFGLTVIQKYTSPMALADSLGLSPSLNEFVHKIFKADPKKRPRAFELGSYEFLATDASVLDEDASAATSRLGSVSSLLPVTPRRQRRESSSMAGPFSRYQEDFVEEGRLGKGGFGEVVKARKKLDGQIYAIKKITQKSTASLTEVLKEVRLLSQLSHPSVVRYYNTWTEEVPDTIEEDETTVTDTGTIDESTSDLSPGAELNIEFEASTGGLDFMSSSGYPQVEFGYDDATDASGDEDDDENPDQSSNPENNGIAGERNKLVLQRTRSSSRYKRSFRTILYISMEYCEKRTLRDLIKRDLFKDNEEIWRLFRQILEGLVHIHSLNVVHRDLKPENVFIDAASNVKIGDFGLATSGQRALSEKLTSTASLAQLNGDMTRSIGTAFYVAPEVKSSVAGTYSSKVDMYSLGVIFFEMCYKSIVGMERALVIEGLRNKRPSLPPDFDVNGKPVEESIIRSLLNHSAKERPSSSELLQSGKLPVQMESETIRQTLAGLSDPRSPYYHKMMSALFSRPTQQEKDFAWDMGMANPSATDLLLQGLVKEKLVSIFRHHGAVETPRSALFPRSGHYGPNTVQLLDPNGTLVQLPYDLTLSHARSIAKYEPAVQRSFAFGPVFRDRQTGGQPQTFGEVDFDIISTDSLDLALKEAEVIKVLDEIIFGVPSLASTQMCFHLNHSDLLELIFEYCRIEQSIRGAVSDTLSKLNVQKWTWQKIRTELRSPIVGVSATSIEDLERFDFRDTPTKAFQKLKTIFEGTDIYERAASAIAHLQDVIHYTKRFEVHSKVYINPLGSLREKFCKGGVVFSCLYDRRIRDVFAAGGRYDSLIREHTHRTGSSSDERHAVGFNLAWEKLARLPKAGGKGFLKRSEEEPQGIWTTKRCDVLVASHDPAILRSSGIDIVQQLWAQDISAELAQDSRSPEELLLKYREDSHCWIVVIKQDSMIKVKTMGRKEIPDTDIPSTSLIPFLKSELRDRDHRDGISRRHQLQRHSSTADQAAEHNHHNEQQVHVLVSSTRSKKSNRRAIVEQAQTRATSLVNSFLDGPIAAIETTDTVMDLLRETRLGDPESWRKATHAVPTAERKYVVEVHELLQGLAAQNKDESRNAFVYNFRTGTCIYYDLGA